MSEVSVNPGHIQDVAKFFAELGGLHDAKVLQVNWTPKSSELAVSVDDLRANFAGLPEHGGTKPAALVFGAVSRISLSGEGQELGILRLFDIECSNKSNVVTMLFSPGGRMEVEFETLTLK
jgi:hypothetical protein